MDRLSEVSTKWERIREFLHDQKLDGVHLSSVANFAWFTGGGDSHVENHNKFGVASIFVTHDNATIITNNIESDRILKEQLAGVEGEFSFAVSQWYDPEGDADNLEKLSKGLMCASDGVVHGMKQLGGKFNALRYQYTDAEVEKLRWLCRHSGRATEAAARAVVPGMSEHQIEALTAQELTADTILPVVILVAADDRNFEYRHPVPTQSKFTKLFKLVTCSRKWGLIVSLTRLVHVGVLSGELKKRQEAVAYVDAVFTNETKPGVKVGKILDAAKAAYMKVGYEGEWKNHHQGGAIGYEARDYIGISESEEIVQDPQGFAWNPSIGGNKSEDSMLVGNNGTEFLTMSGDWPVIEVTINGKTYQRPAILEI